MGSGESADALPGGGRAPGSKVTGTVRTRCRASAATTAGEAREAEQRHGAGGGDF
jgi:hypothetical protein